jgi:hypothetical protein
VHLDQVLLTGQSMPVPHQHQDVHTGKLRERHRLAAVSIGELNASQIDGNVLGSQQGTSLG